MKKINNKLSVISLMDSLELYELNKGIIRVDRVIADFTYTEISMKIKYLLDKGFKKIEFKFNSPGGDAYSALALHDIIKSLKKLKVKTIGLVEGIAASAASMVVLQACDERLSLPNARYLIHEPRRWVIQSQETTSNMLDTTTEMVNVSEVIYSIMANRTGQKSKDISKMIDRKEYWMNSEEALKFGLIDRIIK